MATRSTLALVPKRAGPMINQKAAPYTVVKNPVFLQQTTQTMGRAYTPQLSPWNKHIINFKHHAAIRSEGYWKYYDAKNKSIGEGARLFFSGLVCPW